MRESGGMRMMVCMPASQAASRSCLLTDGMGREGGKKVVHLVLWGSGPKKTSSCARIPLMVTRSMQKDLSTLGYTSSAISAMTPAQAAALLAAGKGPS